MRMVENLKIESTLKIVSAIAKMPGFVETLLSVEHVFDPLYAFVKYVNCLIGFCDSSNSF